MDIEQWKDRCMAAERVLAMASMRWREKWFGSPPQKGSWIYADRNPVAFIGETEADHAECGKIVLAHNAALEASATHIRTLSAQLSEARREGDLYRRAYGCLSCGECHPLESMCPPHEVRSSGMGSYRQQIGKAVARATAAESEAAALRERVRVLETALEPFAEAATKGEIGGYPPNYFVGATEFENARRARAALAGGDNA